MTFDFYQTESRKTAIYPADMTILYPALGLAGEAGEVCEKIKKAYRDRAGVFDKEKRDELKKELGDVLWYLSQIAGDVGLSLDDIAHANLAKLHKRQQEGKLQGSGDNR